MARARWWRRAVSATRRGPAPTRCSGAEIELCAPAAPGLVTLAVRFDAAELDEPHEGASSPFNVSVVAAPEHVLTVTVVADGGPVDDAIVRARPRSRHDRRRGRGRRSIWPRAATSLWSGRPDTTRR